MTRTVLHLTIPHESADFAESLLTRLRPQLRNHGVAFVGDADLPSASTDFAAAIAEVVEQELARTTRAANGPPHTVLLSSVRLLGAHPDDPIDRLAELFRPAAAAGVQRTIAALGAASADVVMHVRRQDTLLELRYAQQVASGVAGSFDELLPVGRAPALDYLPLLDAIAALPSVHSVVVRPHELAESGADAYLRDLLDAAGIPIPPQVADVAAMRPQQGLASMALLMAAQMNAHLDTDAQRRLVHDFLRVNFAEPDETVPVVLKIEQREQIIADYAQSNALIRKRFAPKRPSITDGHRETAPGVDLETARSARERTGAAVVTQLRRGRSRWRQRFSNDDAQGK